MKKSVQVSDQSLPFVEGIAHGFAHGAVGQGLRMFFQLFLDSSQYRRGQLLPELVALFRSHAFISGVAFVRISSTNQRANSGSSSSASMNFRRAWDQQPIGMISGRSRAMEP